MWREIFLLLVLGAAGAASAPAAGGSLAIRPNEVDPHTLHLWHLDEAGPPFANAAAPSFALAGLLNGAQAGAASWPGLGQAVSFRQNAGGTPGRSDLRGAILAMAPQVESGGMDNAPADFRYVGEQGAFTIDLMLRLEVLPQEAPVLALGLVSMDGDGGDRIFNFRIERQGFLAFIPLTDGGAVGGGIASLPVSGPHAMAAGQWYHAAVTYDGNEGVTNNLQLYWTRMGSGVAAAHLIGRGTLSHDLNGLCGDFAVGNEARTLESNAEAEPFPGVLDEVRISAVARHPTDFCWVPPAVRMTPEQVAAQGPGEPVPARLDLQLASLQVDGNLWDTSGLGGRPLELSPGLYRLDFEFGLPPGQGIATEQIRYQFEGIDEGWQTSSRGMALICQAVDDQGKILSRAQFPALGRSEGWETTLEDSTLIERREPFFIPAGTTGLRLLLSSGSPDTTGSIAIDRVRLTPPGAGRDLWPNGEFDRGENLKSPAGVPAGWSRSGTDAAIARSVECRGNPAAGLVDGDQAHHGEWTAACPLTPGEWDGRTLVLSWAETYNVIGGTLNRASYVKVPPGHYTFRAIGLTENGELAGAGLALPVVVRQPFTERPWFWPMLAGGAVALIAAVGFNAQRRRARQRLERLYFQHQIERDRTRIARDIHDDLGTRVSVLNMNAALALRDLEEDPDKTRRHLNRMTASARELVVAMDDLVWAVNPAHDTLDHLASHLTRLAGEVFADSPVRCRLDIPAELPARPISSETRHHLALAAKEAMHNILQHAGPCQARVSLSLQENAVTISVEDDGCGFDMASLPRMNGLHNLKHRAEEVDGQCTILSSPGQGTCVTLVCPLPAPPA